MMEKRIPSIDHLLNSRRAQHVSENCSRLKLIAATIIFFESAYRVAKMNRIASCRSGLPNWFAKVAQVLHLTLKECRLMLKDTK